MLPVDTITLIKAVGYIGIFAIVFAESGLLIGFFLPGDSLLFTAGFLASQGALNIWLLAPLCFIAAVTGDAVGYAFGSRVGRRLFQRQDSRFFHRRHLARAETFFERRGGGAVILARFIPVVRTLTPVVAGIGKMGYRRFATYNIIGALLWAVGVTLGGYFLGKVIPGVDRYLLPLVVAIIILSLLPGAIHLWREVGSEARLWIVSRPIARAGMMIGIPLLVALVVLVIATLGAPFGVN